MAIFLMLLVLACYFDYRSHRIPNWLVVLLLPVMVVKQYLEQGTVGVCKALGIMVLIMFLWYPLFRIGTIGAGDIKLFGVCSGILPPSKILSFLFFSLVVAGIFSLAGIIQKKNAGERICYFLSYLQDVITGRQWRLYITDRKERERVGVCMAGPVLISLLLYWGGVY